MAGLSCKRLNWWNLEILHVRIFTMEIAIEQSLNMFIYITVHTARMNSNISVHPLPFTLFYILILVLLMQ